jgi:methionyl-tRNA synthetase
VEKIYLTTAINYTNGSPHIGHAYEAVTTDVLSRFHRIYGRDVRFQTGSDEHGQKIANAAQKLGKSPIELCDLYVKEFQSLNKQLQVEADLFLRTTDSKHHKVAQLLYLKAKENGDIYLDNYNGWYNVKEETFVTELEAKLTNFKDPASGSPLIKMTEVSYFFRLSKYQAPLIEHLKKFPSFIQPAVRREEILKRLEEPLNDLSITRTSFQWGVPVPHDPEHVLYVWFDALSNYLTGLDYPDGDLFSYWPAIHVIGKDILWFHAVIWPSILMSCGLTLPLTIFAHGFVNDANGEKMSKSIGNVIDPFEMIKKYGSDTFRFFLCKQGVFGSDLPFDEEALVHMHNADLSNSLGNLVNRGLSLCNGCIPDAPSEIIFSLEDLSKIVDDYIKNFEIDKAAKEILAVVAHVNKYLTVHEPWKIKEDELRRNIIIRSVVEAIYALTHFLYPFIPQGCSTVFEKLGTSQSVIPVLDKNFKNLKAGEKISSKSILFPRLNTVKQSLCTTKQVNKENCCSNIYPELPNFFSMIDVRVGKIVKAWAHPEADKLFCELIDVGESEPRPVASGLRAHYEITDLIDRFVLVVCNLKPMKMLGFQSCGMVLCAKSLDGAHVTIYLLLLRLTYYKNRR